jgi:hypothetical protein
MTRIRSLWLLFALIGAVVPAAHFVFWMRANDAGLAAMFGAWFANASVSGLAWDVIIAATAFSFFIIHECRVKRDYLPLVSIAAIVLIGLSFGLPLYLFLRTRKLA